MSPTKLEVCGTQCLVLATNMNKMIEMHFIELDNPHNSVRWVHLSCIICITCNIQAILVTGFDGPPIFRASAIAQ